MSEVSEYIELVRKARQLVDEIVRDGAEVKAGAVTAFLSEVAGRLLPGEQPCASCKAPVPLGTGVFVHTVAVPEPGYVLCDWACAESFSKGMH